MAATLAALDRTEIALLHLLKAVGKPVNVAFFSRLNPPKNERWSYGTFTQRFQGLFSTVKERLVRRGVLVLALARQTDQEKTNMERWRFALPASFDRHPPPLLESVTRLDGEGDWRRDVAGRSCEPSSIQKSPARPAKTSSKSWIADFVSEDSRSAPDCCLRGRNAAGRQKLPRRNNAARMFPASSRPVRR